MINRVARQPVETLDYKTSSCTYSHTKRPVSAQRRLLDRRRDVGRRRRRECVQLCWQLTARWVYRNGAAKRVLDLVQFQQIITAAKRQNDDAGPRARWFWLIRRVIKQQTVITACVHLRRHRWNGRPDNERPTAKCVLNTPRFWDKCFPNSTLTQSMRSNEVVSAVEE